MNAPFPRFPHPNLQNLGLCQVTWPGGMKLAGRVKSTNQLTLRWEDYPWLSQWPSDHKDPYNLRRRAREGEPERCNMRRTWPNRLEESGERAHVPKYASSLEKLGKARALWILPASLQEKCNPDSTLFLGQWDPQGTSDLQNGKVTNVQCSKTIKLVIIVLLYSCMYMY